MASGVLFHQKLSHQILSVIKSQAVLNMDESMSKECAKMLINENGYFK